ncbi:(deoxy)nucleoside triphosphate pyrophosphohydrolase [uncultured Sphingomonas sp.]|uniref:(deoxy)nucleoside triphosphate pyrophosphohydrolase n=1 Tax=uncultured Sphingomonas sp. TaxID=158754 RepID=UPI0035CB2412
MTNDVPAPALLLVVAAALIRPDGTVLAQQRPTGKQLAGLWEFPGGKIEMGESPEAALVRELREELGIEVALETLSPVAFASEALAGRHLVLMLYAARTWQGDPQALEASALQWVTMDEMAALPMPPADVPLVAALQDLIDR